MGIDYTPRGASGYRCEFVGDGGLSVKVDWESDVAKVEVAPEGLPTRALVGAVERHAEHEFALRRTRNEKKRRHHEKEAKRWRAAAEHIGALLGDLTETTEHGWCSACLTKSDHRLSGSRPKLGSRRLGPRRYVCVECGSPTGWCEFPRCRNFAHRDGSHSGRALFCAEHDHEIPSFEKLTARVDSLEDYLPWLEFEHLDARKITTIAAATLAGMAVVGPLAYVAAPAIGGAVGAATGLSGAAATSHGLALLGGGAVAAGGYGMLGGTVVVTAAGVGLGGASGARVANAYVRNDKSFGFEKLSDGNGVTVIFANGFLSEGETGRGDWEQLVGRRYPDATVYRLTWGAKELKSLAPLAARSAAHLTEQAARQLALQATTSAGKLLGPLSGVFTAASLAKNPWHVARTRATMTGSVLADAIVRSDLSSVVLVGFSLGARVMTAAAAALSTRHDDEEPRIQSMHLLGAAVGTRVDWHSIETAVDDRIWNYWSTDDKILRLLYRLGEAGTKAVGCERIPTSSSKVKNVNVSRQVHAHQDHLHAVTLR